MGGHHGKAAHELERQRQHASKMARGGGIEEALPAIAAAATIAHAAAEYASSAYRGAKNVLKKTKAEACAAAAAPAESNQYAARAAAEAADIPYEAFMRLSEDERQQRLAADDAAARAAAEAAGIPYEAFTNLSEDERQQPNLQTA